MSSFMRSEEMALCQMFLQSEAAYACVSELGELGLVQFRDLNPDVSSFQRKFVNEVRRCDEMERKLRYIEKEIKKDCIPILDAGDNPEAPGPGKMVDLEASFDKLESELKEVNGNAEALRKNFLELTELKHILRKTQQFFDEVDAQHAEQTNRSARSRTLNGAVPVPSDRVTLLPNGGGDTTLCFIAGVIPREKLPSFERMLWRACRGNVFLRQSEIEAPLEDPITGEAVWKSVFVVFFQGDQLKMRVKKICEGFRANVYPCPESPAERREMAIGVMTRIEDLNTVLGQTTDHRHRVLVLAAKNIKHWFIKACKIKAIYHTLNMFNLDVTQKCLIAECWVSTTDLDRVQQALQRGTETSGSAVPAILNRMATTQIPPTYNRTNKFTKVFQSIVDAYGVNTYREVNPAPFSIITFPFLFSVMFGDFGHGFIMFLFALWMVLWERQLTAKKITDEIWNMFFGGRYLILMMGLFSVYSGLVYNDIFSKSVNIFGSAWGAPGDYKKYMDGPTYMMDPNPNTGEYSNAPYPFGVDPVWAISTNRISFNNSFKQKISVIFGVAQMFIGIFLGIFNQLYFQRYSNILAEVIPMALFLSATFGYLIVLIFAKWVTFGAAGGADGTNVPPCAPKLLIGLINMYLMKYPDATNATVLVGNQTEILMNCNPQGAWYSGQQGVQYGLVALAVICIPWILLAKPLTLLFRGHTKKSRPQPTQRSVNNLSDDELDIVAHDELAYDGGSAGTHDDHDEMEFSDIMVHQAIHTIEFCLGCVSHTASYLRLWALSLAHGQLSEVLWTMVLHIGTSMKFPLGAIVTFGVFTPWAALTIAVLLLMEGLSAFLHTLRLHWVEFQSKFYDGNGYAFVPYSFEAILAESLADMDD